MRRPVPPDSNRSFTSTATAAETTWSINTRLPINGSVPVSSICQATGSTSSTARKRPLKNVSPSPCPSRWTDSLVPSASSFLSFWSTNPRRPLYETWSFERLCPPHHPDHAPCLHDPARGRNRLCFQRHAPNLDSRRKLGLPPCRPIRA